MRLHHVALKTKSPAALAAFYTGRLELEEQRRHEDAEGLRSIWLSLGDAILMIERSDAPSASPPSPRDFDADPPGLHLLALTIAPSDAPKWRARLPIVRESKFTLYFADPEGNRLALSSFPEPLAQ